MKLRLLACSALVLTAVTAAAFAFAGCSSGNSGDGTPAPAAFTAELLLIDVILEVLTPPNLYK